MSDNEKDFGICKYCEDERGLCHIPSSGLSYACFHLSIMFKFLKPELRNFGSLKNLNKKKGKNPKNLIHCSKMLFLNV